MCGVGRGAVAALRYLAGPALRRAAVPARWRHCAPCRTPVLSLAALIERLTWAGLTTVGRDGASFGRFIRPRSVDSIKAAFYLAALSGAPSSNGKTTDSDSVN